MYSCLPSRAPVDSPTSSLILRRLFNSCLGVPDPGLIRRVCLRGGSLIELPTPMGTFGVSDWSFALVSSPTHTHMARHLCKPLMVVFSRPRPASAFNSRMVHSGFARRSLTFVSLGVFSDFVSYGLSIFDADLKEVLMVLAWFGCPLKALGPCAVLENNVN